MKKIIARIFPQDVLVQLSHNQGLNSEDRITVNDKQYRITNVQASNEEGVMLTIETISEEEYYFLLLLDCEPADVDRYSYH